jgi:hypothetical protein
MHFQLIILQNPKGNVQVAITQKPTIYISTPQLAIPLGGCVRLTASPTATRIAYTTMAAPGATASSTTAAVCAPQSQSQSINISSTHVVLFSGPFKLNGDVLFGLPVFLFKVVICT